MAKHALDAGQRRKLAANLLRGGLILFLVAVLVYARGVLEDVGAGTASARVLEELNERRDPLHDAEQKGPSHAQEETDEIPVEVVGAYEYLGSISIPVIGVDLPVCAKTDDDRLRVSPCRYAGSYLTDDLVICGEGYASHFGSLGSVGIRDEVAITTVDGAIYHYIVSNVETDDIDEIDAILDDWDMALFTFNSDGSCCVVRCVRT